MRAMCRIASCSRPGLALGHRGDARVAALADGDVDRDLPEQLQPVVPREPLAAAAPEDLRRLAAVRADEGAHVLHEPDDGDVHPLEHRQRLPHVRESDVLRRRDEDRAGDGNRLRERQLGVRGAGWQIHDEVVEVAPVHVTEELLDRPADEGSAPDDGLAVGHEEGDRDDLDPVPRERLDLPRGCRLRRPLHPQHLRDVRAGDVRVEEPDGGPVQGERGRQVDADRALADAALARRHGDDVLHARDELRRLRRGRAADRGRPVDLHVLHPEWRQRPPDVRLDLVLQRAGRGGQVDGERHARPVHDEVADHLPAHQVATELRFAHRAQGVEDGGLRGARHAASPSARWGAPRRGDGADVTRGATRMIDEYRTC